MSDGVAYADIVIMALVAGFILLRLRSVLGDKVGNDSPSYFQKPQAPAERAQPVVKLDDKLKSKRGEPDPFLAQVKDASALEGIQAIKDKDGDFLATSFVEGAKAAFEMVFDAYAKGDRETLKFLLAADVYAEFDKALEERERSLFKEETTLVSVTAKDIPAAVLEGVMARVTVRFISEQVSVTRDEQGAIVGGDASLINTLDDEWTFERDVTSRSPNWKVIET